jgi:WD40 repeat protein
MHASLSPARMPQRKVRLWDVRAGKEHGKLCGPSGEVHALALSGHALVAGGSGQELHVYDLRKMKLAATLRGHMAKINALAAEGGCLVSGDGAGRLRRWQLEAT